MGEGHSEETLDIQMRSSVLPSAPGVGGQESSQREDEARHCCVRRPKLWAPQRQLLALTANSPSRPRLHSPGGPSPGGSRQSHQAETCHAPAPLLPAPGGLEAGLARGLL